MISRYCGGAPAAVVVFSGEVNAPTAATAEPDELRASGRAEKLGKVAAEFDRVHDIRRGGRRHRRGGEAPPSSRRSSPA